MKDHFKFAIAYWHSFVNTGNDPFGPGTKIYPWDKSSDVYERAYNKMDAAFEFISKLGLEYFCFHDFDLIDEGSSLKESEERLNKIFTKFLSVLSVKKSISLNELFCSSSKSNLKLILFDLIFLLVV